MSFGVSLDNGALEYSGTGTFRSVRTAAQFDPTAFLVDACRSRAILSAGHSRCRHARQRTNQPGRVLAEGGYGDAFRDDHLLPMASAIWSAPPAEILAYPAAAFIRFHDNHGLLATAPAPGLGNGRRRQPQLCPAADPAVRGPDQARYRRPCGAPHGRWRDVTDSKAASERYRSCGHGDACGSGAGDAGRSEPPGRANFSAHSATAAILQCCTRTRASCRSGGRCGRAGTILALANAMRDGVCVTYWMNRLQNIESDKSAVRHSQSIAAAARRNTAPQRGLRSSNFRCEGDRRATKAMVAARRAKHLVLRRLFRLGLPRRRAAGGPGRRRAARRRASALARTERIRPHRADRADRCRKRTGAAAMTLRSALYVGSVMHRRLRPARASIPLSRLLVPARSR